MIRSFKIKVKIIIIMIIDNLPSAPFPNFTSSSPIPLIYFTLATLASLLSTPILGVCSMSSSQWGFCRSPYFKLQCPQNSLPLLISSSFYAFPPQHHLTYHILQQFPLIHGGNILRALSECLKPQILPNPLCFFLYMHTFLIYQLLQLWGKCDSSFFNQQTQLLQ